MPINERGIIRTYRCESKKGKQMNLEEYGKKIKDYSTNMLNYELEETQINLDAELMFLEGRDLTLIKNLQIKIATIKSVINRDRL